ncbi:MAG TPA: hypothetical protein PK916_13320 [Bacteroidota bacterium]|nr:hypothetical protein [Bacteroidota bacterium]
MTLQDLSLGELMEMEKALKILRYSYENPSYPPFSCPLCVLYLDESTDPEDPSCTICPHISIDGADYTGVGKPCNSNPKIPPEHREISFAVFRTFADDAIVFKYGLNKEDNNVGSIRNAHIRRVIGWILKVQYEIQRRHGV